MATQTTNYKLNKPGENDFIEIEKINENFDKIDTTLFGKVDKVVGKELSSNDYTNEEKNKLKSLENYTHPETHPASMIVFDDGETLQDKLNNNTLYKQVVEGVGI